ncbi:MAG: YezD family protein [Deltaproteobacteria bacterium]
MLKVATNKNTKNDDMETDRRVAEEIMKAVREIRYGSIQITIHESKVVQIDKTEKVRW